MKLLGEYYREKVLSLKPKARKEVRLPWRNEFDSPVTIEPALFGWRLHTDREFIELPSEEEARYCKVFAEIGAREILVPKDLAYLKSFLPELEELKQKADRILNEELENWLSRKHRRQIFQQVWSKAMWEEAEK